MKNKLKKISSVRINLTALLGLSSAIALSSFQTSEAFDSTDKGLLSTRASAQTTNLGLKSDLNASTDTYGTTRGNSVNSAKSVTNSVTAYSKTRLPGDDNLHRIEPASGLKSSTTRQSKKSNARTLKPQVAIENYGNTVIDSNINVNSSTESRSTNTKSYLDNTQ